jgi:hypothetical protein
MICVVMLNETAVIVLHFSHIITIIKKKEHSCSAEILSVVDWLKNMSLLLKPLFILYTNVS